MPRTSRQGKIIELVNKLELETQEELVAALRNAGYPVTQATISRDIKDLGLYKVSGTTKRYRYAAIDSAVGSVAEKYSDIFREVVISITPLRNEVIVKSIRGTAEVVGNYVERLCLPHLLGVVNGTDTTLVIMDDEKEANNLAQQLVILLDK